MSNFQQAMLLRIQCEMQALVSEREGMIAANKVRERGGDALAYGEDAFQRNADSLRYLIPDPHQFG